MTTLAELLKQREDIDAQITAIRAQELNGAKAKIREIVEAYGLTAEDIFPGKSSRIKRESAPVQPKYRDPATGVTWTGRGKPPSWIAGKERDSFLIA